MIRASRMVWLFVVKPVTISTGMTREGKKAVIPKKLKIGGHLYKIKYPHEFEDRDDCKALHISNNHEIRIRGNDCSDDGTLWVSLFHEVLHAIDGITGHNHLEQLEEDAKLRYYVDALAEGLYQVLVDNKLLKVHT